MRGIKIHAVQQWALAWLVLEERNEKSKEKNNHEEYMMWVINPIMYDNIYGNKKPADEEDAMPVFSDELAMIDKMLRNLENTKTTTLNFNEEEWSDWQ